MGLADPLIMEVRIVDEPSGDAPRACNQPQYHLTTQLETDWRSPGLSLPGNTKPILDSKAAILPRYPYRKQKICSLRKTGR